MTEAPDALLTVLPLYRGLGFVSAFSELSDDVVLFPCSGDLEQLALLARVLRGSGTTSPDHGVLQDASPPTEVVSTREHRASPQHAT
jgi:hypothetical protein